MKNVFSYSEKEGDDITDKSKLEQIARKYTDMLYAHALVILKNKSDAEDAAENAI